MSALLDPCTIFDLSQEKRQKIIEKVRTNIITQENEIGTKLFPPFVSKHPRLHP